MTNITKEKLIDILKTKAIDCFIHNDLLVVDMPNRMIIKNIDNKQEYVDIYLENLNKSEEIEKEVKRTRWHYTDYDEQLIKLNYNDIFYLKRNLGRTERGILKKIKNMKKKGMIPDYKPLQNSKIEGIIDVVRQCRISLDDKTKILLEVGRNFKEVEL